MASVNKVILVGNLGRDPEVRYMPNGDAVANYSIATTETWKDKNGMRQEKTEWHNIVMYRRLAEIAGEYLKKGSSVYIEGRLQTRKWQDKQGNDRYTTEIVADQMQMLGGRNSGGGGGGYEGGSHDGGGYGGGSSGNMGGGSGNRGGNYGAPQGGYDDNHINVVALVDQAVVVKAHKNLAHGGRKAFVHGKAQARPVNGIAQGAGLIKNAVAVFVAPFPHPVNKGLASKILAAFAFLGQGAFHHVLGGNARMVGAGNPQHVLALLAGMTAKHVDKGMVERVPYVQRARDVGRWNDNGIRLAGGVRIGRKGFVIFPVLAPPGFNVMGLIALG